MTRLWPLSKAVTNLPGEVADRGAKSVDYKFVTSPGASDKFVPDQIRPVSPS